MKAIILGIFLSSLLGAQTEKKNDVWSAFNYFVGTWEGSGEGRFGFSTVEREYIFVMGGTFFFGLNKSVYDKQEQNPEGEIHDNWDIFSYDKNRKKYVLRQFHAENIINQYVVDSTAVSNNTFEFISEFIENFGAGWRAKEAYEIVNENEFIETFSLAAPGEDFSVFVKNHFKRKK